MDATASLPEPFQQILDPQRADGKRHPLRAVLSVIVLAMMAGMRGLQGVVDFGRNLPADVVASLDFTRPKTLAKKRGLGDPPGNRPPGLRVDSLPVAPGAGRPEILAEARNLVLGPLRALGFPSIAAATRRIVMHPKREVLRPLTTPDC